MTQTILPKKIIEYENVSNYECLFLKRDLQIDLYESNLFQAGDKDGFIVLDFGKEMCGGIRILTSAIENKGVQTIRIRFGESLSEAYAEIGYKNACIDHSVRDFEQKLVSYSDITVGGTGYRFVRIDFKKGYLINIKGIYGVNNILHKKVINKYLGEDRDIKKIFETAKRTVDLCTSGDYVWDGIKRDRLVWSGDLYPEVISLTYLYGRVKQVEKSLDFERTRAKYDDKWISSITTYSMWWIACVCDYYNLTKAKDFVKKQLDYVVENINQFNQIVDEDGTMNYPDFFVDWPTFDHEERRIGSRFISIFAVKKAIQLFNEFNIDDSIAKKLLNNLMKSDMIVKEKKQIIALKYFALGEITDREYNVLIDGGAKGFSTFMGYFILKAIASRDKELAIKLMKEYYMAMINRGATTFFEDFDMDWLEGSGRIDELPKKNQKDLHGDFGKYCYRGFRHSLCHAWSCGVIKFISEYCK